MCKVILVNMQKGEKEQHSQMATLMQHLSEIPTLWCDNTHFSFSSFHWMTRKKQTPATTCSTMEMTSSVTKAANCKQSGRNLGGREVARPSAQVPL